MRRSTALRRIQEKWCVSMTTAPRTPLTLEPGRLPRPQRASDQTGLMRWLPGLYTLRHYDPAWLRDDIMAGLVLTTMLVPVGIAYAVASGVPGIYGLYATIIPLLAYALFGPSRILVLGPDSSLAAVILAVVLPLSGGDPMRAVTLASMMAIVSGAVCILAGLARLGFITELLSKPIRYGYMNGIALTVLISQLPKLFGFSIEHGGPVRDLWAISKGVIGGQVNWTAFLIGVGTLGVILTRSKRSHPLKSRRPMPKRRSRKPRQKNRPPPKRMNRFWFWTSRKKRVAMSRISSAVL